MNTKLIPLGLLLLLASQPTLARKPAGSRAPIRANVEVAATPRLSFGDRLKVKAFNARRVVHHALQKGRLGEIAGCSLLTGTMLGGSGTAVAMFSIMTNGGDPVEATGFFIGAGVSGMLVGLATGAQVGLEDSRQLARIDTQAYALGLQQRSLTRKTAR